MSAKHICPKCGVENEENWPLAVGNEIRTGGCQTCWERHCGEFWWRVVTERPGGNADKQRRVE